MNTLFRAASLFFLSLVSVASVVAQATPSATQPIHIVAFGGLTGAYTGLQSSRNLSFTAGVDIGFRPFYRLYPSAEVRGTYPVDSGGIAGERNALFGLKLERPYREILHPYGDILYGRNKIVFEDGGYPNASGTLIYLDSIASVVSFGGGIDIDLNSYFSAKFDGQFQRYETPVTSSGAINTKAALVAVVYRFDFNRHFHYDRKTGQVTNLPKEAKPPAPPPPPPPPPPSGDSAANPADTAPPPADATTPPADTTATPAPASPASAHDATTPAPSSSGSTTPPSAPGSTTPTPDATQPAPAPSQTAPAAQPQ